MQKIFSYTFMMIFIIGGIFCQTKAQVQQPGFDRSDIQLKYEMDKLWQPVRRTSLTNEQKKTIYDRFSLLIETLEQEAKKPGVIITVKVYSGSVQQSGTTFSGSVQSGTTMTGIVVSSGTTISSNQPTPISGGLLSGSTGGNDTMQKIVYTYQPTITICETLLQLDEKLISLLYQARRDLIGASTPSMKQSTMTMIDVIEFIRILIADRQKMDNKLSSKSIIIDGRPIINRSCIK